MLRRLFSLVLLIQGFCLITVSTTTDPSAIESTTEPVKVEQTTAAKATTIGKVENATSKETVKVTTAATTVPTTKTTVPTTTTVTTTTKAVVTESKKKEEETVGEEGGDAAQVDTPEKEEDAKEGDNKNSQSKDKEEELKNEKEKPEPKEPVEQASKVDTRQQKPDLSKMAAPEESSFLSFIVVGALLVVCIYLLQHNKKKILGLMFEGRGSRRDRVRYRRLSQRDDVEQFKEDIIY